MYNWIKQGSIYNVNANYDWNQSHAQVPVVDVLKDRLRVYYSTRNTQGMSNVSYLELDIDNPSIILYENDKPILELGNIGAFDDCGIMPSSISIIFLLTP